MMDLNRVKRFDRLVFIFGQTPSQVILIIPDTKRQTVKCEVAGYRKILGDFRARTGIHTDGIEYGYIARKYGPREKPARSTGQRSVRVLIHWKLGNLQGTRTGYYSFTDKCWYGVNDRKIRGRVEFWCLVPRRIQSDGGDRHVGSKR